MRKLLTLTVVTALLTASWLSAQGALVNYRFDPATGNVYAVTDTAQTWTAAEAQAVAAGTHLATINNGPETLWVSANYGNAWIGYYDPAGTNNYVWSSGQTPGYVNWNAGEPNNVGYELYAQVIAPSGLWNNLPGTSTLAGVAEFEVGATVGNYRYNPATQHVYANVTTSHAWGTSELVAQALGGHLATINDGAENEWVRTTMTVGWIGFNDVASEGNFVWASGEPVTYTNWNPGEPNNSGGAENYTQITGGGGWNDLSTQTIPGIVEFPTAVTINAARYNPANGHVYLKTNSVPWEDAERMAMAQGGHLAAVNDAAENNFVRSFGPGWIGFTDKNQMNNFQWTNGDAVTYQNWNPGEPNGGNVENYAEVLGNGLWNDLSTQTREGIVELSTQFQLGEYRYDMFTQHVYARTNSLTWSNAQILARAVGADLATINDAGENAWVRDYGGNNWIGLNDAASEGTFVWASGQPVTYTSWAGGEPNGGTGENYGVMYANGTWNDAGAAAQYQGIVEFPATLAPVRQSFNPATGRVYVMSNAVTWENAEVFAMAGGGHLATIRNAGENEYVAAVSGGGWIGYTDRFNEDNFTWTSGEAPGYTNWNTGEPNGGTGENYGMMYNNGRWNDAGAATQAQGILEFSGTHSVTEYKFNAATGHVYARTDALPWLLSATLARAARGDLVTINDAAENAWVQANYADNNWIGLYDVADQVGAPDPPGVWQWANGEAVGYTNFGTGEPNGASEDHATLRGDGYWNDLSGYSNVRGIVEFPDTVPGTTLSGQRFNPVTGKLYALTPSATWRAAELIALVNNGHLTTVNDAAENQWLADNMTGGGNRWIGNTDEGHEGGWVWASGEGGAWIQGVGGSSYTNWNPGPPEPNGGTGENFGMIYANALWNDAGATAQMQGIVEMAARTPQWRFNPGSGKLNAQTDNLIWSDAEAEAQFWGGHLATVPNAAANEFIRATWGGGWIGLNDAASEGNFVWASGQPVAYTNWNAGEPNNSGDEDYTDLTGGGGWNDLGAAAYRYGIAERNATPPRWIFNPSTGRWYARTDNLLWADSEAQSQYWTAHLTTINDATENAYVAGRFGTAWIGLNDAAAEGTFVWVNGEPVSYTNWNAGEPNNAGDEDYAQISGGGGWNDLPGTYYLTGVAEGDTAAVQRSVERIDGQLPAVSYAILGLMTWEEAEAAAQELGGHLATVGDQSENDFLQQIAAGLGQNIWLGYTDKGTEGTWVWVDGKPYLFTNWNAGEPNNSGDEDYAMMYWGNGLWNDANASAMAYAVVEFVPEPTSLVLASLALALLGLRVWRRGRR